MPGPISDQYKGPRGTNPVVPSWMIEDHLIRDHAYKAGPYNTCKVCAAEKQDHQR